MFRKKWFWFLVIFVCCMAYVYHLLQHERFGADPSGERLARIEQSANYKDGQFFNTMPDPTDLEKENFFIRMYKIHFAKDGERTPSEPIPSVKTDLKALDPKQNVIIPLGHSSYYMQINGLRILIDPVFNTYAAPFSILNQAFDGTNVYSVDDMPYIDYILISHDHYDHLDYETMKGMMTNVDTIIAPLGVGEHLELWGYAPQKIKEGYWYDSFTLKNNVEVSILPARHYSSRLFSKNKTLWAGFAIVSPDIKIFYSGDTGYGDHIKEIAEKFGSFDMAILDVGQFNPKGWPHIHMLPEHAAMAAEELHATYLLPAHNSKFAIALHDWKDPLTLISKESEGKSYTLLTPKIGEVIQLDSKDQMFAPWWLHVK